DYYMSEWYPDRRIELTVPEKVKANGTDKAYLYLWVVPSMVSGHWCMDLDLGTGKPQLVILSINQRYQMLAAAAETILGSLNVESPTLNGDQLDFSMTVGAANHRFTGKVQGDKLEGTALSATSPKPIPWRANKLPPNGKCAPR
ncbi:MAG TPA: hypothetical protein VF130_05505, partial [Candidatus Binatia bacterium]